MTNHYQQFKTPPDFFTAGGFSAAMAVVTALKKTNGDTNTDKLITAMEGMSFDTPKGKMTFRKEDHQAMQSMYHFKIKADPALRLGRARPAPREGNQAGRDERPDPQQALGRAAGLPGRARCDAGQPGPADPACTLLFARQPECQP